MIVSQTLSPVWNLWAGEVDDHIQNLSDRRYSVRVTASIALRDMLDQDWSIYPQIQSAIDDPGTSLEALTRLHSIRARYFLLSFEDYYDLVKYRAPERWGGGRKLSDSLDVYADVPVAYIWSLPREHRFHDDRDVASEFYVDAQEVLGEIGLPVNFSLQNDTACMRYATHLWAWEWLTSGQDPAIARQILSDMALQQEREAHWLNQCAYERQWRGMIETRSIPLPIEERLLALQSHAEVPIPPEPPTGTGQARAPDMFNFHQFIHDAKVYVAGIAPDTDPG